MVIISELIWSFNTTILMLVEATAPIIHVHLIKDSIAIPKVNMIIEIKQNINNIAINNLIFNITIEKETTQIFVELIHHNQMIFAAIAAVVYIVVHNQTVIVSPIIQGRILHKT